MPNDQNRLTLTVLDRRDRHDGCEAIAIEMNGLRVIEPAAFTAGLDVAEAREAMNDIVANVRAGLPELFAYEPSADRSSLECVRGLGSRS